MEIVTRRGFPKATRRVLVHPARLILVVLILAAAFAPVLAPTILPAARAVATLAPAPAPSPTSTSSTSTSTSAPASTPVHQAAPVAPLGSEAAAAGLSSAHAAAVAAADAYGHRYAWVPSTWLPGHLFVLYYGNPLNPVMGALGQGTTAQMLARLRAQADAYAAVTNVPVQPGLDYIATVAQGSPQPDNTYRLRMPANLIDQEVAIAEQNHMPLFLDVQIGHSTVPAEVQALAPYLKLPFVNLALDPEFDLPSNELPGVYIGSMSASDVNWAMTYLSRMVAEYHLPQKVLIVHEFTHIMLPGWAQIQSQPGVALVFDMDGFGGQAIKTVHYTRYVANENLPFRFGGIKLFYTQDKPLFTPAQVLKLQPTPSVVLYQ